MVPLIRKSLTVLVHVCRCFFKLRLSTYFFSHFEHIYLWSSWIDLIWMSKSVFCSKSASQYLQTKEQLRWCRRNMSFLLNVLSHLSHEMKFDPWTVSLCLLRSDCLVKVFKHIFFVRYRCNAVYVFLNLSVISWTFRQ